MDGATNRAGLPSGHGAAILGPRPRWNLRPIFPPPDGEPRHRRGDHLCQIALAESLRRTPHRLDSSRVRGPHGRARRDPPAPNPDPVLRLLPSGALPPFTRRGRPHASSGSARRIRSSRRPPPSRWSPLRVRAKGRVIRLGGISGRDRLSETSAPELFAQTPLADSETCRPAGLPVD